MAIVIVVEDGSVVTGANTYVTKVEATELLLDNLGLVPSVALTDANMVSSAQYLETFRKRYQGVKVSADQSLQFPRQSVYVDCNLQPSDEIPLELKLSQALAAYEESNGNSLQGNTKGQTITSKNIAGAISVGYSDNGMDSNKITFTQLNGYLHLLFKRINPQMAVFRA